MASVDDRVLELGIKVGDNITWYTNYAITAKGTKVTAAVSGECDITIRGLKKETQNFILKNCRYGQIGSSTGVTVILNAGRASYGASEYFRGNVYRASPIGKPDRGVQLKCLVGYSNKRVIVSRGGIDGFTSLNQIARWVAEDNGYNLSFEITDTNIRSYSFTGSAQDSIRYLEKLSNAEVFVDNNTLYVKNQSEKASGRSIFEVSNDHKNLISAQATEVGVVVKALFHPSITIGSVIDLTSELNPFIDGQYTVYKMSFDIAKRESQFYITAECTKYG